MTPNNYVQTPHRHKSACPGGYSRVGGGGGGIAGVGVGGIHDSMCQLELGGHAQPHIGLCLISRHNMLCSHLN